MCCGPCWMFDTWGQGPIFLWERQLQQRPNRYHSWDQNATPATYATEPVGVYHQPLFDHCWDLYVSPALAYATKPLMVCQRSLFDLAVTPKSHRDEFLHNAALKAESLVFFKLKPLLIDTDISKIEYLIITTFA